MNDMINSIFLELSKRFQGQHPNAGVSEKPFRVLELVTRLSNPAVAAKSYELFGTIMESNVTQERKMEAARLALRTAYRPTLTSVPPVGDPKHIFDFLHFHIAPNVEEKDYLRAISSAMRAIDSASGHQTSQAWSPQCIKAAGDLLTGFQQSSRPEGFKWWYGVLWIHYGRLDSGLQSRVNGIAMNGDDRIDLKQCRIGIEEEIERVKKLDGVASPVALEEAFNMLITFIDQEQVRDEYQTFEQDSFHFTPPVAGVAI